jgi:protein-disulfide isomerase
MDKRFWAVVAVIILIFGGIFWATSHKSNAPTKSSTQATNHVDGKNSAGVTLVEYGDFQCPGCGQYYQSVRDTVAKYNKQISFQFRNFPLTQLHPNAFAGARAAEAAGMQGKYWEMHDLLYQQNVSYYGSGQKLSTWISATDPLATFTAYAKQLGLNEAQFKQDYASEKVNSAINADVAAGNKLGVDSTPTFFLDGQKIQPQPTTTSFAQLIDDAIAAKK